MRTLINSLHSHTRGALLLAVCLFLCGPAAAQPPQEALRLSQIEFEGLARVSREDALARLGLAVGQTATPAQIEEAAVRLQQSGLFRRLGYSVRGTLDAAVLTFKVEEMKWGVPVVFDNFVWFTDEELAAAVRRQVPTFDGTAPEGGGLTDEIARALSELLRSRQLAGEVEYTPSADPSGRNAQHVFAVKGAPALRVCTLHFPGARELAEEELVRKSAGIFDNNYSRLFVRDFVASNLLPLYHERGMLRAAFAPPEAKSAPPGDDCAQGLAVTVYVDEGSVYVWERAEWSGQQALTAQELDAALGMRARDVASSAKIEKGLAAVRRAYGRKGYLAARVAAAEPVFDDTNRKAAYRFTVTEGAQYRMGAVTITGLDERDTNNMKVRWRILPGEVYDEGYLAEFLKKNVQEFLRDTLREGRQPPFKNVGHDVRADHEKLTVDVTLNFKN